MFFVIAAVILVFAMSLAFAFTKKGASSVSFEDRLRAMSREPGKVDLHELELSKPFSERIIQPIVGRIGSLVTKITPHEVLGSAAQKIKQAGLKIRPASFVSLQIILAAVLPAMLGIMGILENMEGLKGVGTLLMSGVMGYFMPELWLTGKVNARKGDITRKLPDALDLLTVSVEAGLGFDMALSKVVEKLRGPLAEEFMKVLHEIRMGKPRRDAMKAMADRVGAPDLAQFISALVQADKLGVSIANVLRVQSDQMRLKRRQRAEETAMKAPLKMSFVLVFFVLPALMIVLLGPAAISVIMELSKSDTL